MSLKRKFMFFLVFTLIIFTLCFIFLTVSTFNWKYHLTLIAPLICISILSIKIYKKIEARRQHKQRIAKEQKEIKEYLKNNTKIIDNLYSYEEELKNCSFLEESLAPLKEKWDKHLKKVKNRIEIEEHEHDLRELAEKKKDLRQEVNKLTLKKQELAEDEEEEREKFLEEFSDNIYLYTENLAERQQKWLSEAGFERTHQWDIFEKKTAEILIKPRSNESVSHAYLIGAIKQFIQDEIDPRVKLYETKLPDIVFKANNKEWAIEVETGSLYRKNSRELKEKIDVLNQKYPQKWFFVVTNKNLATKYRKFGETVDRKGIIGKLKSITD